MSIRKWFFFNEGFPNEVMQQFPVTWAWLLIMAASCLSITLLLEAAIGPGEAAVRGGGSGTGTLRI